MIEATLLYFEERGVHLYGVPRAAKGSFWAFDRAADGHITSGRYRAPRP